jgi:hypothetical protein
MIWKPERGVRVRGISIRPGYGERKRAREAEKLPLFADLPGMLLTAEEYEQALERSVTQQFRRLREQDARNWVAVRYWYQNASEEDKREFERRWRYLPHKAEYAADAMRSIIERKANITYSETVKQRVREWEELSAMLKNGSEQCERTAPDVVRVGDRVLIGGTFWATVRAVSPATIVVHRDGSPEHSLITIRRDLVSTDYVQLHSRMEVRDEERRRRGW